MNVRTQAPGLQLLESFEKCRLTAYLDGGGVPTIGWGHTQAVKMGDTCSQAQADSWLLGDLTDAENAINSLVTVVLRQDQFDALACFVYNVGATQFAESHLLKYLNQNKPQLAASEFLRWNKDNGVVVLGLVRRRKAERDLFLSLPQGKPK